MKRTASAIWNGGLKDGQGSLTTESGMEHKITVLFLIVSTRRPGWIVTKNGEPSLK